MDKPAVPFQREVEMFGEIKRSVVTALKDGLDPTSSTMARQFFDWLDAANLFLQQLSYYQVHRQELKERAAESVGEVVTIPVGEK